MSKQELLKTEASSLCALARIHKQGLEDVRMPAWWLVVQCPRGQRQEQVGAPAHRMQTRRPTTKLARTSQDNFICMLPFHHTQDH